MEGIPHFPAVFLLAAAAAASFWYLLDYFDAPRHHPDEPLVVSPSIHYIGHIIGLLRHGIGYYEATRSVFSHVSRKKRWPMYLSAAPNASSQYTP